MVETVSSINLLLELQWRVPKSKITVVKGRHIQIIFSEPGQFHTFLDHLASIGSLTQEWPVVTRRYTSGGLLRFKIGTQLPRRDLAPLLEALRLTEGI